MMGLKYIGLMLSRKYGNLVSGGCAGIIFPYSRLRTRKLAVDLCEA